MFGNRTITVTFPNQGNIVISCEGNILDILKFQRVFMTSVIAKICFKFF